MVIVALVLAGLAATVHVYIFALESVLFDRPSTWRVFGIAGAEDAAVLKPLFFNQGFYNLFLAIGAGTGIGVTAGGDHRVGLTLVLFGCASMLAAAAVLAASDPKLIRSAAIQGGLPALALLALAVRALT